MTDAIKNPVLRFVVHGHVVLASGAALQVWWIGEEWLGQGSWSRSAAAFFATIACYGFNRLMRSRDSALKEVPLFSWYRAHAKSMTAVAWASAAIALALIARDLLQLMQRLWPVVIPALLYVTPIRTRSGGALGLRSIPGLKSLAVAWVWAAGTVLLAADGMGGSAWMLVLVLFGFYWSIAIAFDLRDALVDPERLRTLPQLFGPGMSKGIALLLLVPLAIAIDILHFSESAAQQEASVLLPMIGLLACAVLVLRAAPTRRWFHWLALDACIALIPALSLLPIRL
jgi:hypothetical protein